MAKKVTVTITSDTTGFRSGLTQAETGLTGFSNKLKSTGQSITGMGKNLTIGATVPLVAFGVVATKAFNESNAAAVKLSTNLLNVEGNTKANVKALQDQASALQKKGVIEDDAIIAGQAQLATFKLQGKTIQALTPKIADMAAQMKGSNTTSEDMVKLNNLVGKVLTGNVGALSRYGITLDENQKKQLKNGNETERAAILNEVLAQNFGKVNEALAKTPEGKATLVKNQFGDLQETVGEALVPVITKGIKFLTKFITGFNNLSPAIKKFIVPVGIAVAAIGPLLLIAGSLTTAIGSLIPVFAALGGPVTLIILGVAALAAGLAFLYFKVEPVKKAVDGLFRALKLGDWEAIGKNIGDLFSNLGKILGQGITKIGEFISKIDWGKVATLIFDGLGEVFIAIGNFIKGVDWGKVFQGLGKLLVAALKLAFVTLPKAAGKALIAIFGKLGTEIGERFGEIKWGEVAGKIGTALLALFKLSFVTLPKAIGKLALTALKASWEFLKDVDWGNVIKTIATGYVTLLKLVWIELPKKLWDLAWKGIKASFEFFKDVDWGDVISKVGTAFLGLLKLVWIELPKKLGGLVLDGIKAGWNFIKDIDWGDVVSKIGEAFVSLLKLVFVTFPSKLGELGAKAIKAGWKWVVDNGGDLLKGITDWLKQVPGKLATAIGDLGKILYDKGKDLIQGLLDGAGSLLKNIGKFFLDKVPSFIKGAFKKALGISSPSKVFKGYGQNIVQGLINGISGSKVPLTNAMAKLSNTVNGGLNPDSLAIAGTLANARGTTTIINNTYNTTAQMLNPSVEAGRVIAESTEEYRRLNGGRG